MEIEQINEMQKQGKLWDYIVTEELNKKHKGDTEAKEIVFAGCIGAKVLNKKSYSYNALTLTMSSAGKDHLTNSVLKIFPKDVYETYGRISAKALNYLHSLDNEPDYTYDGKILYLKEITDEILNNEVMKEFTSGEEEISQVAITKQKGAGVDVVRIKGHPVVLATTANTIPSEEIRNRFNIVTLDISEEQTGRTFICEEERYDENIRVFLSNLKPYSVEIPKELLNFIIKAFPKNKVRYRRDFQKLLDFIKAITLFNQDMRDKLDSSTLVAETEDYDRAKDIFVNAFSSCSEIPLKDIDRRIVTALEKSDEPLPARNILNEMGGIITLVGLYPHLRNLVQKEVLNELQDRDKWHNVVTTFTLSEEFKEKKPFLLPNYYGEEDIGIKGIIANKGNKGNKGNKENEATLSLGGQNSTLKPIIPLIDTQEALK